MWNFNIFYKDTLEKGPFNMKTWMWKIWAIAILPAFAVGAQEAFLYNNSTTFANYNLMFPNNLEVGDQIWLDNYTAYPYLAGFSFEYYSPNNAFTGAVSADVRFYLNDGTPVNGYATPDTLFYDTGPFDVQTPYSALGIDYAVLGFTNADLYTDALLNLTPGYQMPDNFTISITFSNLSGSDQVGLPSFEPPTVGTNYGDYWVNFGGVSWIPLTNSVAGAFQPVAFGMQFFGVPEPATVCLAALGAALVGGFAARRRQ